MGPKISFLCSLFIIIYWYSNYCDRPIITLNSLYHLHLPYSWYKSLGIKIWDGLPINESAHTALLRLELSTMYHNFYNPRLLFRCYRFSKPQVLREGEKGWIICFCDVWKFLHFQDFSVWWRFWHRWFI